MTCLADLLLHAPEPETALAKRSDAERLTAVRAAVVGVSGYAGGELARLLLRHPRLLQTAPIFFGRSVSEHAGSPTNRRECLEDLHPQLAEGSRHEVLPFCWDDLESFGTELIFFATPHEQSRERVPEALARGYRVIDLSGAWRLHDPENQEPYRFPDRGAEAANAVQEQAVYGCPELDHDGSIEGAKLVANPGCYATSILLALAPLLRAGAVDLTQEIICDAKSGVSGAGKAPTAKTHFMHAADNLSAYAVFQHRHTGELLEQLGLQRQQIRFTPHLLPIPRGILSSIYLRLQPGCDEQMIEGLFNRFYAGRPLVRVRPAGTLPQILDVAHTSRCDLGFALEAGGRRLLVVSCLDNLLKGAAGQAVQNMNRMLGWPEAEGLR